MLDLYAFYIVAAATLLSSFFIFLERKLIRAVMALTAVFIGSAMVFLLLGQTFIAILTLIVFVGGLSTYLIVAVATEEKGMNMINMPAFLIIAIVFLAALSVMLLYIPSGQEGSIGFFANAISAFESQAGILYIIVIMLFAITLSGTIILKKFTKLIV